MSSETSRKFCGKIIIPSLVLLLDCLHLQLYRDSKDRFKQGQTKASLSLQTFLGVQSGFTLDKESNTIAIICQDVTVVLAFDTRERLIQWQVKIAHNLGEDEQFLVQVCTAPLRAKLTAGPARLHVLAHQFCMTVGLPPRLVGCWRISQLRRYGVVNSKFCFEGGSRCGRGEGLYVLVTDQGEEITRTFRLAAEGKLSSKKRPSSRNSSDSPKKSAQSRLSDVTGLDTICLQPPPLSLAGNLAVAGGEAGEDCCECECGRTEWQGHHGDDFADTSSVSEFTDSQNKEINAWTGEATIERCASCISKLGGLSRSSTATATITANPIASHTPTPSWTMEHWTVTGSVADRWDSGERSECCPPARPPKPDRLSAPVQPAKSPRSHGSPNSSPKKRQNIPPSQAQEGIRPTASACPCNLTVNPYDNYDVPKGPQGQSCQKENNLHSNQNPVTLDLDYYDTPKNIKESYANEYGNYDTPPPALSDRRQMCTTLHKNQLLTRVLVDHDELQLMCPCRRLVCWTDSWMLLPYCRRGSGRERTPPPPPPLHKRASEGRGQAVTDQQGSVYATVDKSKKTKNRQLQENHSSSSSDVKLSSEIINTQPLSEKELKRYSQDTSKVHHEFKTESAPMCGVSKNYMNFDFVQSLEFYENSKEMMQKTVGKSDPSQTIDKSKSTLCQSSPKVKICTKCRHECKSPKRNSNDKQDDYLMMEPSTLESLSKSSTDSLASCSSKYVPGYIPMHPIGGTSYINNQDLLKFRMCQQMLQVSERATSSPSLSDASADGFRRRSDTETHRPGSSVVFGLNQSVSASNTPYLRRRILGCVHEMVEYDGSSLLSRQRSFSTANSQRNPVECATDEKIEIHRSLRDSTNLPREPTKLIKRSVEFDVTGVNFTSQETSGFIEKEPIGNKPPQDKEENQYENVERSKLDSIEPTVHIRRSSSAPSKSSHNRDSSSSNDSGVSSCSLKKIQADFVEMDVQIAGQPLGRRYTYTRGDKNLVCECPHATLPRKSKSTDPMQGLAFHLPRVELPLKSSSAEAEVPVCHPKRDPKGCMSPGAGVPYMDSRSTSSGTSDMSDYCETLSLSSYSSTDTPDGLHFGHHVVSTMKPRSGKEYQKIDRNILEEGSKNNQPALVKSTKEDSS